MTPLEGWHEKAGVRRDPRRVLHDELEDGSTLFPLRLIPYLDHPLVVSLGPQARAQLVARHTFQYFAFTAQFETRVVNRATERLANDRMGIPVTPQTRFDAYKIYCDEAYHSLYSYDVIRQLEAASGTQSIDYDFQPFLDQLDRIAGDAMGDRRPLSQMLQVVVFETLVTAILNDVPRDRDVVRLVRETVADHARDEGRHHAFFAGYFKQLWSGLSSADRVATASALPRLITQSLIPDLDPVRRNLHAAGLSRDQVEDVIADVYRPDSMRELARQQARASVRLFREVGVVDLVEGRDAFQAEGLIL
ncbi:diiron oxygenase [Leifsonia sp. EB34]|uniref:diiron oxygenase n=1 Tax=Leifsonia sp. EB34 TaxID=3156303 RepID=UPI003519B4B5